MEILVGLSENSINKKILKKFLKLILMILQTLVIPGGYLILKLNEKRITKKKIKY